MSKTKPRRITVIVMRHGVMQTLEVDAIVAPPFALHATPMAHGDMFTVTHTPTGWAVENMLSRQTAEWLFAQCQSQDVIALFKNVRLNKGTLDSVIGMSKALKAWGRDIKQQCRDREERTQKAAK